MHAESTGMRACVLCVETRSQAIARIADRTFTYLISISMCICCTLRTGMSTTLLNEYGTCGMVLFHSTVDHLIAHMSFPVSPRSPISSRFRDSALRVLGSRV